MNKYFMVLLIVLLLTSNPVKSDTEITAQWVEVIDENNPVRMNHLSMVFDYRNDVLIQFSGRNFNGTLSDKTLVYDFNTNEWTNMDPQVSPPARQYSRMSYNPNDGTVLLFGGANTGGMALDDFWQYDYIANNWTEIIVSPKPSPRYFQAMEFSPLENSLIMFDGMNMLTSLNEEFFWEFNLTSMTWIQYPVSFDKELTWFRGIDNLPSMVYDSKRDNMLLFTYANVLQYNMDNHSLSNILDSGISRYDSDATYDCANDKIIQFGGSVLNEGRWVPTDSTAIFDPETLEYDLIDGGGVLGVRFTENNMAYDPIRNRTILLSGSDEDSYYNDMWLLTLNDPNKVASSESTSVSSVTESSSQSSNTQESILHSWMLYLIILPVVMKYARKSR